MNKNIRVLHLSTHDEECGIAIYQQNIVDGMGDIEDVHNVFFAVSPNKLKLMRGAELDTVLSQLFDQLKEFDILHVQHEYSFYNDDQLQRIVDGAKAMDKKVLFTLHTPPHAHRQGVPRRAARGLHPRSIIHARRVKKDDEQFVSSYILPLNKADILVATSKAAVGSFTHYGVDPQKIAVIYLPVPEVDRSYETQEITQKLNKQAGDIILSTTGFLTPSKGIIATIKALSYLPENYKLAIIGGSHPSGQNDPFYDQVCDIITQLNLAKRVYITGFVADDAKRDALLRETQICLYPYDKAYYDYVSSAALTNAIANDLPIVAYKTKTFLEANDAVSFINFAQGAAYYELARVILDLNIDNSIQKTKKYAEKFSVKNQAELFTQLYLKLLA